MFDDGNEGASSFAKPQRLRCAAGGRVFDVPYEVAVSEPGTRMGESVSNAAIVQRAPLAVARCASIMMAVAQNWHRCWPARVHAKS